MRCTCCDVVNPADSRFCDGCGASLQPTCPACAHLNRPQARFCAGCGRALARGEPGASEPAAALPDSIAALLSSRFAREGERKQVTVLFADIRNSTELIRDLDPEQALHRLEPALHAMAAAVHQYGGTVNRIQGDGVMALFGAPLAYEDHAVRACLAAQAMIEAVSRLIENQVAIRVGINSGEVVVRSIGHDLSMDYDAVGATTHLANRMEQLAAPGTACLTARTAHLVRGFMSLRPLGATEIKGIVEPLEIFQLVGAVAQSRWQVRSTAHRLTPFVGRETELRILADALQRARSGRGQVVAIGGEAGMGKSRLVHEFLQEAARSGLVSLTAAATPHDLKTPYQLIAEMLRNWIGVAASDNQAAIGSKLDAAVAACGGCSATELAPLRALLNLPIEDGYWDTLDAAQRRQATHDAIRALVTRIAGTQACAFMVEDMHWADPQSQSVLDRVIDGLGRSRVLVIVTYRPEYRHHWGHLSYCSLVQLKPLDPEASDLLLRGLLGHTGNLESLRGRLVEEIDGTPLFLEEMARTLVETGVLVSEPTHFRLTQNVGDVTIPDSVQTVLAARIDRLPSAERTLLQIASVIGKDVPVPLLAAVADVPADLLAQQLLELRSQEFLDDVSGPGGAEYSFKHALTHSVAYGSMLVRHRRTLHGQIVAAIERAYPDRVDEFTERLAEHALSGELWDKAAHYALLAGQRANASSAHRLATRFFQHAIDALQHLPADPVKVHMEIDVRLGLRVALAATGDLQEVLTHLQKAEALARSLGDERRLMPIMISRATMMSNTGALDEAVEAGLRGHALAVQHDDQTCMVHACYALGQAYWNQGEFGQAEQVLSRAVAARRGDHLTGHVTTGSASVLSLVSLSHTYSLTGRFGQAFARSREALAVAGQTGRPYDLSYAHAAEGLAHLTRGDLEAAIHHLEEARRLALSHEITLLTPHSARYLGRAYALAGRLEEAAPLLAEALDQSRAKSLTALQGWCAASLGMTRALAGAFDAAETFLNEALQFARSRGYRPLETHALRLLGTTLGRAGGSAAVRQGATLVRQAADLAEALGMVPEQAQTRSDLGGLLMSLGDDAGAREQRSAAAKLRRSCGIAHDSDRADISKPVLVVRSVATAVASGE